MALYSNWHHSNWVFFIRIYFAPELKSKSRTQPLRRFKAFASNFVFNDPLKMDRNLNEPSPKLVVCVYVSRCVVLGNVADFNVSRILFFFLEYTMMVQHKLQIWRNYSNCFHTQRNARWCWYIYTWKKDVYSQCFFVFLVFLFLFSSCNINEN